MNDVSRSSRRRFFARIAGGVAAIALAGCQKLSQSEWFPKVLGAGERLSAAAGTLVAGRKAIAGIVTKWTFRRRFAATAYSRPQSAEYEALVAANFADYHLAPLDGLVARPGRYSLAELRALESRTQITRHDCVEGWSAIGKWKGVPLASLLEAAQPTTQARFAVFHRADPMEDDGTSLY